jgi:hypothetical protein
MTYTINGKQYTKSDINKRCADLMGIKVEYPMFNEVPYHRWFDSKGANLKVLDLCNNPTDTWPIINKCWDELMTINSVVFEKGVYSSETEWNQLMEKHNCSKLVAACICLIEMKEGT